MSSNLVRIYEHFPDRNTWAWARSLSWSENILSEGPTLPRCWEIRLRKCRELVVSLSLSIYVPALSSANAVPQNANKPSSPIQPHPVCIYTLTSISFLSNAIQNHQTQPRYAASPLLLFPINRSFYPSKEYLVCKTSIIWVATLGRLVVHCTRVFRVLVDCSSAIVFLK